MFEQALGEERFRDGVRRYLARHARGNATSADFMAALAEAAGNGSELPAQFAGFINQPGVPLIRMSLECKGPPTLKLEQQRLRGGCQRRRRSAMDHARAFSLQRERPPPTLAASPTGRRSPTGAANPRLGWEMPTPAVVT
jgi:alanyl aminopeptidase